MYNAGLPKPMLCGDQEGWGEEGNGEGALGWKGHMYAYG